MPRKTRKATNAPPILGAKTVAEFVAAARDYGVDLPESWAKGSVLAEIWTLEIEVREASDPHRFVADARRRFPKIGAGEGIAGRLQLVLTPNQTIELRNAIGAQRLTTIDLAREQIHGP